MRGATVASSVRTSRPAGLAETSIIRQIAGMREFRANEFPRCSATWGRQAEQLAHVAAFQPLGAWTRACDSRKIVAAQARLSLDPWGSIIGISQKEYNRVGIAAGCGGLVSAIDRRIARFSRLGRLPGRHSRSRQPRRPAR